MHSLRMSGVWERAQERAELRDETITDVIKRKLIEYLGEPPPDGRNCQHIWRRDAEGDEVCARCGEVE